MSDTVIKVENLSKKYILSHQSQEKYTALRDVMTNGVKQLGKKLLSPFIPHPSPLKSHPSTEEFYALRDVSFEIKQGERVGIIGRNGAGKSTLLKVLSRITEPSLGRVEITGRVASLLEVGTGFHPELTGRENIYLNGAILGMSKADIKQKFDEIVAFAEVEQFLDTPVKRYSSGMYVRLAFAVAAHLEPEILIVDEVLAVGDAQFQKKCLGKMGDVSNEGRTILFVSHNMAAVKALCTKGIILHEGHLASEGDTAETIDFYLKSSFLEKGTVNWADGKIAPGNENIKLHAIYIKPLEGAILDIDSGVLIETIFHNAVVGANIDCTLTLLTIDGINLFQSGIMVSTKRDSKEGYYKATCQIPPHLLNAGSYKINLIFGRDQYYALFGIEDITTFEVQNTATGRGSNMRMAPGIIRPRLEWSFEFNDQSYELEP